MKGIVNFEAVILLLAFFALTGIFLGSLSEANNSLETKTNFVSAKSDAIKCAMLADSVYSNSGSSVSIEENCFFEEGKIKSKIKEQEAEEKTLTEKIINSEKGMQIGVEEHYK